MGKPSETELDVSIDPENLANEWKGQPYLFWEWAARATKAQDLVDRAKSDLDLMAAELEHSIRSEPGAYGLEKSTEAAIKAAVLRQPEYKKKQEALHSAKYEHNLSRAAVDALEHRKRALSMLVELWIRDYYADPNRVKDIDESVKKEIRGRGREKRKMVDDDD